MKTFFIIIAILYFIGGIIFGLILDEILLCFMLCSIANMYLIGSSIIAKFDITRKG